MSHRTIAESTERSMSAGLSSCPIDDLLTPESRPTDRQTDCLQCSRRSAARGRRQLRYSCVRREANPCQCCGV